MKCQNSLFGLTINQHFQMRALYENKTEKGGC